MRHDWRVVSCSIWQCADLKGSCKLCKHHSWCWLLLLGSAGSLSTLCFWYYQLWRSDGVMTQSLEHNMAASAAACWFVALAVGMRAEPCCLTDRYVFCRSTSECASSSYVPMYGVQMYLTGWLQHSCETDSRGSCMVCIHQRVLLPLLGGRHLGYVRFLLWLLALLTLKMSP